MPDDNYRPTHGLPPDSRPTNVPPDWWAELVRDDLPKSGREAGHKQERGDAEDETVHALRGHSVAGSRLSVRRWVTNVLLVVVATLLLTVGVGNTTATGIAAVVLGIAILTLAAVAGIQIARRSRRHL